jgi:AcrR family transcriptional regulator
MASVDRRARERAELQERILDAARALFVREGFEAVSLRKIADAIEYTPPAIYTHFRDKNDLIRALCRRDFGALSEALLRASRVADPVTRILRIGQAYIRFAVEHPHHYRFMFMTPHPRGVEPDPEDLRDKDDPERNGYAALRRACQEAIRLGRFLPEHRDPELLAQVFWAGVHGVASLQIAMGEDPWIDWRSLDRRARVMTEVLIRGVLTPEAAREFSA